MDVPISQLRSLNEVSQVLAFLEDCYKAEDEIATPFDNQLWPSSTVLKSAEFWKTLFSSIVDEKFFELEEKAIVFKPKEIQNASPYRESMKQVIRTLKAKEFGVFWGAISEVEQQGFAIDVGNGAGVFIGRCSIEGGVHIGTVIGSDKICQVGYGGACRKVIGDEVQVLCRCPWSKFELQWEEYKDGEIDDGAISGGNEADHSPLYIAVAVLHGKSKWVGKVKTGFNGCNIGYNGREISISRYQMAKLRTNLKSSKELNLLNNLIGPKVTKDMLSHSFFDTYKELVEYSHEEKKFLSPTPKVPKEDKSIVMLCHDMKGGYCKDADEIYRNVFTSWEKVDLFCYFSHHFISIPPRAWVKDCSMKRKICLGTIITEGKAGRRNSDRFLHQGEANMDKTVDKLVQLCIYFGFHGWLVNFESPVKNSDDVISFLNKLTLACKKKVGSHARVIYYDSLNMKGRVHYENALTNQNKGYFEACDGIFTNYWIRQERIESSLIMAGEKRARDVFFGIDVFGRGTPYKAGAKCSVFTNLLSVQGASVAVFAPAWTVECGDAKGKDLEEAKRVDKLFWNTLFPNR